MSLFEFYQRGSPLHRRNPLIKAIALALVALVATPDLKPSTAWYDPGVPLVFLALLTATLSLLGRIPLTAIVGRLLPLILISLILPLFSAFTFPPAAATPPLLNLGPLAIYREGLLAGLGIAARLWLYAACALAFVATTDPADLTASLIRQTRVAPGPAFALFARARFFATLRARLETILAARRLRGLDDPGGRWRGYRRHASALLGASARHARRAALARESKGFHPSAERTTYRQTGVTPIDWSFLMAVVGITLVLVEFFIFAGLVDGVAF